MTKRKEDLLIGIATMVLGGWAFHEALGMDFFYSQAPGPGFFPLFISGLLVLLGVALVAQGVRSKSEQFNAENSDDESRGEGPADRKRVALVAGGWIVSIALTTYLGFVPAMAALMLYLVLVVERKRTWYVALAALLVPILSYIAFGRLLQVHLPVGPLGY